MTFHPFQFSHLPLHSHLGPYRDQKLLHLWNLKPKLSPPWLWLSILQLSRSVTQSTPVLWCPPFFSSQLSPSYLILTVLPSSLPPSILLSTEFYEHFLWAGHCTKCRGCKVDRDVDPSPCSLLSTICLSAHSSPAHLPFCKSPTVSSKPSTFTFPLHPKLPTWALHDFLSQPGSSKT